MNIPRIVYVTCAENGLYGLKYLIAKNYKIVQVITISQQVAEYDQVSGFINVKKTCDNLGIEITILNNYQITPEDVTVDADLLIVNGWNRIIQDSVLHKIKYGGIGIHAGHPPIGLGRAPLPWNIIKGFKDIEVYVFRLTDDPDHGDIIEQHTVEITPQDNVRLLYEKVMLTGAILFEKVLNQFPAFNMTKQSTLYAEYYVKRTAQDGLVNFTDSVENIFNFIRAQTTPYPGAFAWLDGAEWKIWNAVPYDRFAFRDIPRIPGRIIAALPSGIVVQTGSSPLWIIKASCGEESMIPSTNIEQYVGKIFNHTGLDYEKV